MSMISMAYLSPVQNGFFQAVWDWLALHSDLDFHRGSILATTDDPDVLFMCGLPTGQRIDRYEPLVAAVMAQERYGGRPIYFSDLVVRPGTVPPPKKSWRIAYNDKGSFSGWVAPRWGLTALGLEPAAMTWIVTGSHLVSLEAVMTGAADAAGIDSMVLDLVSGDSAPAAGLVTIESFGPWPAPPISTSVGMDRAVRAELAGLLTSMHEDPGGAHLLATWGVERLAVVDAADYERLARFSEDAANGTQNREVSGS
jgi:ABC-type phosphate/phosphonate transport system substrate-binding protein